MDNNKEKTAFDNCIKLSRAKETGRLIPCLPNGDQIPLVVRGSMSIESDDSLLQLGVVRLKMECYMKIADIDAVTLEEFKKQIEDK